MKRACDIADERPRVGQGVVRLHRSLLPFSDFPFVLSSHVSSRFVSSYSLLPHIDDLQYWVCTELGFAIALAKIEVLFPVKDEQYFLTFGIRSSGTVRLDVSDQALWNSVVFMAQRTMGEPSTFLTLLLHTNHSTKGERERRWSGRRPSEDGLDIKRPKIESETFFRTDYGLIPNDSSSFVTQVELPNDFDPSEDEEEDDDTVVTADDMQGIIRTFQKILLADCPWIFVNLTRREARISLIQGIKRS